MPDFDDVKYAAKKTVKAVGSAKTVQVLAIETAGFFGLTVAAPVLVGVMAVTGLFVLFGDD